MSADLIPRLFLQIPDCFACFRAENTFCLYCLDASGEGKRNENVVNIFIHVHSNRSIIKFELPTDTCKVSILGCLL